MSVTLRRAGISDSQALGTAFEAAFASYREAGLNIPPVSQGLDSDIRDHAVWVAEEYSQILGGLIVSVDGVQAHLVLVAVHPQAGGKGVGKALIDTAVAYAQEQGVAEIHLATHHQLPRNVALYQRLGWETTGTEGDKVLMVRKI